MLKSVLTILVMATLTMAATYAGMTPVREILVTGLGKLQEATSLAAR
jgi:hypothetical protein